jgi:hypothetical protein
MGVTRVVYVTASDLCHFLRDFVTDFATPHDERAQMPLVCCVYDIPIDYRKPLSLGIYIHQTVREVDDPDVKRQNTLDFTSHMIERAVLFLAI